MVISNLVPFFAWTVIHPLLCLAADVVIELPWDVSDQDGFYRLDYFPPFGSPPANQTFRPSEIANEIELSEALPGTEYSFQLFYTNITFKNLPTWTASITTVPDPPSNLSVNVRSGKVALVSWDPPLLGGYTSFKLRLIPLSEPKESIKSTVLQQNSSPFTQRDLTPGASYEIQLYTAFENKESGLYVSTNFTTIPNTPGRFIVWFRNETTLLVLWQPPYPAGIYTHYKVSIDPTDALESVLFVEKDGEPPGPAQAAFYGLVPGRAYNISVQTVSEAQVSLPTTAQYRTVPLPPTNVTFDRRSLTSESFKVLWDSPNGLSEFDRYQVSINMRQHSTTIIDKNVKREAVFSNDLRPGRTYTVIVKTVSGNVASWPSTGNITTKPLPVISVNSSSNRDDDLDITWIPDPSSSQDSFRVTYRALEPFNGDSSSTVVFKPLFGLENLLPGRNYSIAITAISNGVESEPVSLYQATRPASPVIQELEPIHEGLNITWKSDVTSIQDGFAVEVARNDTDAVITEKTNESHVLLTNLFPGAGYEIKVFAISHNIWSEPHVYFQAVYPNPPRDLSLYDVSNSSIELRWREPQDSLFDHYIVRYRPVDSVIWTELGPIDEPEAILKSLLAGERYIIEVNSVSHKVESSQPLETRETVRPNTLTNIDTILDSHNITFTWLPPLGRVDSYVISWEPDSPRGPRIGGGVKTLPGTLITERTETPMSVVVSELFPGAFYKFTFYTVSHAEQSSPVYIKTRTMPLITSDIYVVNNPEDVQSLSVRYTQTPTTVSIFDTYKFSLSDPGIMYIEKLANDSDRKVTFSDLVPGRLYNVTMWTSAGGVTSRPLERQDRLFPEALTVLNASHIGDSSITLTWNTPPGDHDAYEVQYLTPEGTLIQNLTIENSITLYDLRPHRNYTFTVLVRSGGESTVLRRSLPLSVTFITDESVPGKVAFFQPVDIRPYQITFEWNLPPREQNGILIGFTIRYGQKGSHYVDVQDFGPDEFDGTIGNLTPGKVYVFQIQARTQIGYGSVAHWEQLMPIWAPPRPSAQVYPAEVGRSSSTVRVKFRKDFFSDRNGQVTSYAVIVAEDSGAETLPLRLPRWQDIQEFTKWPPYQVNEPYYPFNGSISEEFTVGGENCPGKFSFCNGPLKSGTLYRIKIRAFTDEDKYTDTYFSPTVRTDSDNSAVIIGIVVAILLVVVLLIIFVALRRKHLGPFRRRAKKKTPNNRIKDDTLSLPDSVVEPSRPVKLKDFAEHYRIMAADSDFRFSEEYEDLKHVGRDQSCSAADLPVNRPKNRFTNILPYDHSRFKLQPTDDEEGSDYINANYVPGHNSPREFIVTQGPLHSTRDDFWRACWESNSRAIIMLTRCVEKGREKCDHYWPLDTHPVCYGDIQVQILNESHYSDWTIREFKVHRGDQSRVMRHFHFTTWPDFGVPDPPQTLVRFVRAFRERVGPDQRPIVVHCSAGVGRSGTFIALDRILQHLRTHDHVDIFGIVYEMRKERVWMVQTEQQYICIHQCLMAVLEGKENDGISLREIHENPGFEDDEGIAESGM